jgi:hypothetical protein
VTDCQRVLQRLVVPGERTALGLGWHALVLCAFGTYPFPASYFYWATERLGMGSHSDFASALRLAVESYAAGMTFSKSPPFLPAVGWDLLEALGESARVHCTGEAN